ncbi:MAG: hypothetical protein WCR12_08915 [Dysgonamonadaceae bacterium]|nr:hypothetical protein [Dysgonamonadaceae bacterium]MDD3309434.1 hypothetical protein [Dysgonamonadaceae bacterium]MDD3899773.1 hypothetical protein [Dysgonamonadaceae bacterium]MDD4399817.1 hypothetical protein [Dysgonamonadaceae bacterium]
MDIYADTAGDNVQEEESSSRILHRGHSSTACSPHLRGKAKAKTEFGAKINISLLDGYTKVDHFDWDAFNEGQCLQAQFEGFRELTGKYRIWFRWTRLFHSGEQVVLKEKGIPYTGEPLGRKSVKEIKSRYRKRKDQGEATERNQV